MAKSLYVYSKNLNFTKRYLNRDLTLPTLKINVSVEIIFLKTQFSRQMPVAE